MLDVGFQPEQRAHEQQAVARRLEQAVAQADIGHLARLVERVEIARVVNPVFEHRLEDQIHDADERFRVGVRVEIAQFDEAPRHCRLVPLQHGQRQAPMRVAQRVGEEAHAAEVQHGELGMIGDEIIAGVRVGVQHPVGKNLLPRHLEILDRQPVLDVGIDTRGERVAQRVALDVVQSQDAARGELRVHARDDNVGVRSEQPPEQRGVCGFVAVIDFLAQAGFQFPGNFPGVEILAQHVAQDEREDLQHRLEVLQIVLDRFVHPGVLDFHDDGLAAAQFGPVDLAERRRGERLFLEASEHPLRIRAEFAPELALDERILHRRHGRLDDRQDVHDLGREEFAAHTQHLDEFHERAAQLARAFDDTQCVLEVQVEPRPFSRLGRPERLRQGVPRITAAH